MGHMDCDAADADAGDCAVILPRILLLICACALAPIHSACADGGAIVDRGEWGGGRFVLWVNPAPPTVGPTEWTLLHSIDTSSTLPRMVLRLEGPGGVWQEGTFASVDAGSAMQTCITSLPLAGEWTVTLRGEGDGWQPHTVALRVQPAAAPWHAALPWMLLWIPVGVLMVLRESLAMRQGRART